MTYKFFILKNGLTDCFESYVMYAEKHDSNYGKMNDKMWKQYLEKTYSYRFCNSAWI